MKGGKLLAALAVVTGIALGAAVAAWVVLWLSLKASAVRVPAVEGQPPEAAARALQAVGLVPRLQEPVPDATHPAGTVARQRPVAGFQLKRGSTVLLYPSLGAAGLSVPDLVGLPPAAAAVQLEQAGLAEGEHAEVQGEGTAMVVIAQSPAPGSLLPPGGKVSLLINRQARENRVVMPDMVGEPVDVAQNLLSRWGFRVDGVQPVPYPGLPAGVVVKQTPMAGGPASLGTGVVLWASR
ncbi:MAG: PASTA domain-containing protein [Acidobacteriota bacterium]|nr:MAG: hypothetical protein KatS3mg007_0552 [Thermoanaerobaculum sp.]